MEICHLEPWGQDELPDFFLASLNELSNLSLVPSHEKFTLAWGNAFITPTLISILLKILNHPLPRETQNGEESKWDYVMLERCRFLRHSSMTQLTPDQLYSRHNDVITLLSTLMSRSQQLYLNECPQLLAFVTRIVDQFEMNSLHIEESTLSSAFDYARLGDMIQRSTQLTDLDLRLPFAEVPQEMFESLSNAIHLQELHMRLYESCHFRSSEELIRVRSHLVADENVNGIVARLLQNPQSRLQHLDLRCLGLDDSHFIALVRMLPTSRLKYLNVAYNNIQSPCLLEFARQLPRIHSLKTIIFLPNPGLSSRRHCTVKDEELVEALVQGMTLNHVLEELEFVVDPVLEELEFAVDPVLEELENEDDHVLEVLENEADPVREELENEVDPVLEELEDEDNSELSILERYPQGSLLMHYLDINRAGRRILAADSVVPLGLWPYILERAGKRVSFTPRHYISNELHGRRADAIYFFLQSCPRLFDKRVHPIRTI